MVDKGNSLREFQKPYVLLIPFPSITCYQVPGETNTNNTLLKYLVRIHTRDQNQKTWWGAKFNRLRLVDMEVWLDKITDKNVENSISLALALSPTYNFSTFYQYISQKGYRFLWYEYI